MILMISGRCDIPAFYSKWFFQRIKEGFVDVRNPFNEHQISRIYLNEKNIEGACFCTKNPIPMLDYLDEIPFPYYYHITITPYQTDLEPQVISKRDIIQAVKTISSKIGKEKVFVRYDPILLTSTYTKEYHERAFERLCSQLEGTIAGIVISFVDDYKNLRKHQKETHIKELTNQEMIEVAKLIGPIGKKYGILIQTCAESIDLTSYGINNTPCFDKATMENLFNRQIIVRKQQGVRKNCDCLPTVDIGDYNCCSHHCKYCYANYDEEKIQQRMKLHDPMSSVLIGHLSDEDTICLREAPSIQQPSLF